MLHKIYGIFSKKGYGLKTFFFHGEATFVREVVVVVVYTVVKFVGPIWHLVMHFRSS